MSGISLTASMRSNLLSLQNIARQQDIVQNRLATGLKVSSAIDNPSSYYTASSLNNRAADLTALLDAMSQGIQTIKAASETIDSGTKFLEQAKAVANQALEISGDVVATVRTEEELIAAINSGKEGLIVVDGHIRITGNQNLILNAGQSLVGAKYLNQSAEYSSISFDFAARPADGLTVKDNALIADLQINYKSDTRGSQAAVKIKGDNVVIKDVNIKVDIDGSGGGTAGVSGISSEQKYGFELQGTVNIGDTGIVTTRDDVHPNRFYGISSSRFSLRQGAVLNITKGSFGGFAVTGSTMDLSDNAVVNVYTQGYESYALGYGTFNLSGASKINVTTEQNYAHGLIAANVNLLSSQAEINLNIKANFAFSFLGGDGWGYDTIFDGVAGAKIYTRSGLYTVPAGGVKSDFNGYGNSLAAHGFTEDTSQKASTSAAFAQIFADFAAYMQQTSRRSSQEKGYAGSHAQEKQFNEILRQYDFLIGDASYKGINLLDGQSLKIDFNEDRSSVIEIKGVKADSNNLKIAAREWENIEDIEKSVSELETAINSLRSFASAFGNYYSIVTTRQDFTENLINVLEEGADKLTLADMNQESANMLALQTAQQLAVNSLSLASRSAQSILKLF